MLFQYFTLKKNTKYFLFNLYSEIIMQQYGPHVCTNCYGYKKVCPNCYGLLTHANFSWGVNAEATWSCDTESILFCRKCEPSVILCKKGEKTEKLDRETISKLVYYEKLDTWRGTTVEEKFDKTAKCPKC